LLERLAAEKKQAQDPDYQAKLKAAVATTINVVLMTTLFWQITEASTRGCTVDGVPLDCRITNDTSRVSQHCAAAGTLFRDLAQIAAACTTLLSNTSCAVLVRACLAAVDMQQSCPTCSQGRAWQPDLCQPELISHLQYPAKYKP
jgi:hypothetical protein